MIKILIILTSTTLFTSTVYAEKISADYSGTKIYRFKDGTIKKTRTYKNGKRDGLTIKYNRKGVKIRIKMYKNGKLDGIKNSYRSNGILWRQQTYQNGKRNGNTLVYHKDGKTIRKTTPYTNGKIHGIVKKVYSNGTVAYRKCYIRGKKQAGLLICSNQKGIETITHYHKNGKPSLIYQVTNGKRHGFYRRYDKQGKLTKTKQYDNGSRLK